MRFGGASFLSVTMAAGAEQCYKAAVSSLLEEPVIAQYGGGSAFAQAFNPSWIEASSGTGGKHGLLVRAQNCTSCGQDLDHCCACAGTGPKASVLAFAELLNADDVASEPKFAHLDESSVVLGPHDATDNKGTEDPRVAFDAATGTYHLLYTCWGDQGPSPTLCHATASDPTSAEGWTRRGPLGFGQDSKSGAMLIRSHAPHFLYWGAGHIRLTQSDDLNSWVPGTSFITQTLFGHTNVEAGPPPLRLSTGDYVFFINSWSDDREDPDWYQPAWVVLSGEDPTKIIAQASEPLISPSQAKWMRGLPPYQCNVNNVAFLEAAHAIGPDSFRIYFGGADAVIGTAIVNFTKSDVPCTSQLVV